MPWIIALIVGLYGVVADGWFTKFLLYAAIGWLVGKQLQRGRDGASAESPLRPTPPAPPDYQLPVAPAYRPEPPRAAPVPTPPMETPEPITATPPPPRETYVPPAPEPREPYVPSPPPAWMQAITGFFTTGNLFAKVGAILLFFGVAFLIKFVSDMGLFPIEGRLIGTALAANALIAFGWRLRHKRASYALILQGVGFGILYLTVFGAYRQWNLLPAPLAFGVLVAATLLFSMLAVLQNSMALAALAVSGGFSAPLLINTGSGNFVALFSYYAVLNVGILLITWFKAWRGLHLIGFVFTYGVGFLWGAQYFVPEHFEKVEPFLIFHFVLYVIVALRFARLKRGVASAFAVDGLLVFGVPMATFALQSAMVKDTRYGIALSAAAMGLFYLSLATVLFRRKNPEARALVESFLTSGLLFNTLAVPFALSHTWTSAVWAIEGAFLVWYGARQERKTIRLFGFLLQILGYIAYVGKTPAFEGLVPWVNPAFLGALTLFAAAIVTSYQLFKKSRVFSAGEQQLVKPFLFFALVWILYGFYREAYVSTLTWFGYETPGFHSLVQYLRVGFLGGLVLVLQFVARRLAWSALAAVRFALFLVVLFAWPILDQTRPTDFMPYLNPCFLSAMVFAAAALISGTSLFAIPSSPTKGERVSASMLLVLGFGFWTFAHWTELSYAFARWVPDLTQNPNADALRTNVFMILVAGSALLFAGLARLTKRPWLGTYRHALTGFGALYLLGQVMGSEGPFGHGGFVAWVALLGTHYFLLWRSERTVGGTFHTESHFTGLWLTTAMLAYAGFHLAEAHVDPASVWKEVFLLALPLAVIALVLRWPDRFPVNRNRQAYNLGGLLPHVVAVTFLSQYWNLTLSGDPAPLPYLPAMNPLGIVIGACLLALLYWKRAVKDSSLAKHPRFFGALIGGGAFLWLTMGVVRSVHHFAGVGWDPDILASSGQLHAALSIFWSILGLATMVVGHRRGIRPLWIFGCCLLVLVVGKLFVVDLKERGTLERIISFIGTGVVLLLVGYFAPIPPSNKKGQPNAP